MGLLRRAAQIAEEYLGTVGDRRVVEAVQREGEAWLGGTVWRGVGAARVSFSNWSTADADVDRLAGALARALAVARGDRSLASRG